MSHGKAFSDVKPPGNKSSVSPNQQKANTLLRLPCDILNSVLRFLSGRDLGQLIFVCNHTLQALLESHGTITHIELRSKRVASVNAPSFLHRLPSLYSLSIHTLPGYDCHTRKLRIKKLPPTIEKLEIVEHRTHRHFKSYISSKRQMLDTFPALTSLKLNCTSEDLREAFFKGLPASLVELHLVTCPFSLLPETLTDLTLDEIHEDDDKVLETKSLTLPPSLVRLTINSWGENTRLQFLLQSLPINLQYLCYKDREHQEYAADVGDLMYLPPNLRCLQLPNFCFESHTASLCQIHLPQTIFHLEVPVIAKMNLKFFPPGIKYIKITNNSGDNFPDPMLPTDFPSDITSLNLTAHYSTRKLNLEPWFSTLATLDCKCWELLAGSTKHLPRTLTFLSVSTIATSDIIHLPQALIFLRCSVILNEDSISLLPRTLKSVIFTFLKFHPLKLSDDDSEEQVLSSSPPSWPPAMTQLEIRRCPYDLTSSIKNLPSCLLEFRTGKKLSKESTIALPNKITFLELSFMTNWENPTFALFPPILKGLRLDTLELNVNGRMFADLPRTLKSLSIASMSNIHDVDVSRLPPTLTSLELKEAVNLTDACGKLFPRNLRRIILLKSSKITTDIVSSLPPAISLSTETSTFRSKWVLVLPNGAVVDLHKPIHRAQM